MTVMRMRAEGGELLRFIKKFNYGWDAYGYDAAQMDLCLECYS